LGELRPGRGRRVTWTIEKFARDVAAVLEAGVVVELERLLPETVSHVVALDALHHLFLFPALGDEATQQASGRFMRTFRAWREHWWK
jgi:hypothetical protein